MSEKIIREVHKWAIKKNPSITKELVEEIIERGNQEIIKEHYALCRLHIVAKEKIDMLMVLLDKEDDLTNKELSRARVH